MKITYFKSDYIGLSELFGLPAVGKTTFLENNEQYLNVNSMNNKHSARRQILKLFSFIYVMYHDPAFLKSALCFIIQSRLSFSDSLRFFLNFLRVKRESLRCSGGKFMSDQGFFQAVWSVAVFSSLENEKMVRILLDFMQKNKNVFPNQVVILEDDFEVILTREMTRYGQLGRYYDSWYRQDRAQYFQSFILDVIRNYYKLVK